MTRIEWVRSADGTQGRSWNPLTGCTKVSPGCTRCYAERMAKRQVAMGLARHERGSKNDDTWVAYSNAINPETGRWSGEITCRYEKLDLPLHWRKPRTIFVCSMSDLFHESVPFGFIRDVWIIFASARQHTYQVLTKRPARMLEFVKLAVDFYGETFKHVHLGVSIENQAAADARRQDFEATPAAVKFVSYEPALGPVDWTGWEFIDQLIFGGESGPGARPVHPDWFRNARDWAEEHGVARFFKGWGAWIPVDQWKATCQEKVTVADLGRVHHWPDGGDNLRVDKKAGRLLDGQEHNEMPVSKQEYGKGVSNGRAI